MASPKQALSPLLTYKTAKDSLVIDAFFEIFHLGLCLATTGTYFTSCVSQLTPLLRGQSSLRSPCYLHNDILSFALTTIGSPVFRFPDALPGGEVTIRYKQSFLRFMYRSIERAIREYSVFCFVFSAIHDLISAPKRGPLMYDKTFFMANFSY